jgi:hypothetical protein
MDVKTKNTSAILSNTTLCICDADYLLPFMKKKGVLAFCSLQKLSFFFRIVRKICTLIHLPMHYWYDGWKHHLSKVDTVIIFAIGGGESIVNYVLSNSKNARIVLWYWDPVHRLYLPNLFDDTRCEKWSFDPIDCKAYHMKHNTTFYFDNIQIPQADTIYDVCFVGYDKGRREDIKKIEHILTIARCKTNFYIVDDDAAKRNYKGAFPRISYEKVLEHIAESKAILDIIQDGQTGLTIRSMESLFFKKKLITTQVNIKEQDFYHPDNIFVLGVDDIKSISSFLQKTYFEIPKNIVDRYDFTNWLHRLANKSSE